MLLGLTRTWHLSLDMSICSRCGGGDVKKGSGTSGSGLVAPAPAPLDPADDAVLSGALSVILPLMLNC